MNKATGIAAFIFGVAVGSGATWYFLKDKYEKLAQEEIDSVKRVFSKRNRDISEDVEDEKPEEPQTKPVDSTCVNYERALNALDYTTYSAETPVKEEKQEEEETEEPMNDGHPYVIPPEEFGMEDDYDQISLTYFSDHILTDENNEIVEDVERVVGFDSLNHFGEYEDDSVFVRNDRLKCDYEILLDQRRYSDVLKTMPRRGEIL